MADYSKMTDQEFQEILQQVMNQQGGGHLLDVPGAYEVFSEHFNNQVLSIWEMRNPEKAYPDQDPEKRYAYKHLIRYAYANGCTVKVNDGEETIKVSGPDEAIKEIDGQLDEAWIEVYKDGKHIGTAFVVVPNNVDPEESVADHHANEWFDAWWKVFEADNPHYF